MHAKRRPPSSSTSSTESTMRTMNRTISPTVDMAASPTASAVRAPGTCRGNAFRAALFLLFRVRLLLRLRGSLGGLGRRRAVFRRGFVCLRRGRSLPRRGKRHRIAGYGRHGRGIAVRYIVVGAFLIHSCLRNRRACAYNNKSLYHTSEKYCIRNGNFLKQVYP